MRRSATERKNKYARKVDGSIIGRRYEDTKDLAVRQQEEYFREAEQLQNKVKAIIDGEPSILHIYYMDFAEEIKSKSTEQEREILYNKWAARGLSWLVMLRIARKIFGVVPELKTINAISNCIFNMPFFESAGTVAHDLSGNNYNGTIIGATVNQTGKVGKCYYFNDDVIRGTWIALNTQPFTFCAWVNYTIKANGEDSHTILTPNWSYGANKGYGWQITHINEQTGYQRLYLGINSVTSTSKVPNNSWHHVAVAHDGSKVYFYLDGVAAGSLAGTFRNDNTTGYFYIGKESITVSWRDFLGYIDEVRIYNRTLSATEIKELYELTK